MDNLIKVGQSRFKLAEAYRFPSLSDFVPFEDILYASAKFGGPIAITADIRKIIPTNTLTSSTLQNILIFYNNGQLARKIPRDDLHKGLYQKSKLYIVGMDFLPDETLFVISRLGIYNMIDPFTGNSKVYNLRDQFVDENIVEAKVIGKTVVFYTSRKDGVYKFYFVRDIEAPTVQDFAHSELRIAEYSNNNLNLNFLPIPAGSSFSGKIECFVNHHKTGAYRLIEAERDHLEFVSNIASSTLKKLPEIKDIQCMALSPVEDLKTKKIAILSRDNYLSVIHIDPSHTADPHFRVRVLQEDEEDERSLYWCGDSAIVIVSEAHLVLVTLDGESKKIVHKSKGYLLIPELDCMRIFSDEKCEILKIVPETYSNIFLPTSRAKSADLYNAFLEHSERNVAAETSIIEDKKGLDEGVKNLLDAAYFEIDPKEQKILLGAAGFGKSFLSKSNSEFQFDYFADVCKNLRVVNSLRSSSIARIITCNQFIYLDSIPIYFIDLLIRYQLFYLANEIARFLNYDKEIISHIYVEWACRKIEHNPHDENLAEKIFERLKTDENASYAEIAHNAFINSSSNSSAGKDLCLQIIQFEPSVHKRIAFLLRIEQYERALIEAGKSMDPNLIDLIILKLASDPEGETRMWKMVSENARARPRLFKYIYDFKYQRIKKHPDFKGKKKEAPKPYSSLKDEMDPHLEQFATNEERVSHLIWRCFSEQYERLEEYQDPKDKKTRLAKKFDPLEADDKLYLLEKASELKIKNANITEFLNVYKTYLKEDRGQQERPVVDILKEKVMSSSDAEFAKKYKVNDKVAFIAKIRTLMEQPEKFRQNDLIEKLLEEKNKKGELVSYYEVVNMMIDYGMIDKAEKYATRIKSWDEQLFMLKYIATTNSLNIAIDQATSMKKIDDLIDLGRFIEQAQLNPAKYPKIQQTDSLMQKIERAVVGKR